MIFHSFFVCFLVQYTFKTPRPVASCQFHQALQTFYQLVETTCSGPVDNKFWQSTCNKSVDNLRQTCRQQAVASHANASWYRLVVTSLLQDVNRVVETNVIRTVFVMKCNDTRIVSVTWLWSLFFTNRWRILKRCGFVWNSGNHFIPLSCIWKKPM